MNNRYVKILLLGMGLLFLCMPATANRRMRRVGTLYLQQYNDSNKVLKYPIAAKDTDEVEDNPFLIEGIKKREPVDSAKLKGQENPKRYILDKRYIAQSDSTQKWYRNLFIEAGAGAELMIPPAKDYHFDALTQIHFGLGIQLNKYNSLRVQVHGSLGYQKEYDRQFGKYGARLEHLFDWTSYFGGYRPERLLGISSILGVGFQRSRLNRTGRQGNSGEIHGGVQLQFYTGPHGMINLEPYMGLATDKMDLSENRNWRKYDAFYGVNLNYVYYFSNHLTRAARMRLTGADTLLVSWQAPWFVEFSAGANLFEGSELPTSETLGHNVTLSVGKWFSPVIGLRGSASLRTMTWRKEMTEVPPITYVTRYNTQYYSGRLEALFNPLGFLKSFRWDAPVGAYLCGGGEYGWFMKEQSGKTLHCRSEAYTAGLHLWCRLAEGLNLFVEPRFIHNVYKIPYHNVNWNQRFSDNTYGVNVGLTATSFAKRYRNMIPKDSVNINHWQFGLGGGVNLRQVPTSIEGDRDFPLNAHAFAEYRFNPVSGVRLGFDIMSHPVSSMSAYIDYNMQLSNLGYAPVYRNGQWNHNYRMGFLSLGYAIDLSTAMAGYQPKKLFGMEAFAGPALVFLFGEGGILDGKEMLLAGHEVRLTQKIDGKMGFAVNAGVKLSALITKNWAITLTPQLYYAPNLKLQALPLTYRSFFESLDLGVQYGF